MKIPVSSYRLQFNRDFTFSDADAILDYLSKLGISDIYASPVFRAVTGSVHGYDVVDHSMLNPELGDENDFSNLHANKYRLGLGWIQDIVPNHMAFHGENLMLRDLLEHGENSVYRDFFDIEWHHAHESLRERLLVPFLGGFYSESLEKGEIKLAYEETGLFVRYYEHKFPLSLESYPLVLGAGELSSAPGPLMDNSLKLRLLGTLHQFTVLSATQHENGDYDRTAHAKIMLRDLYRDNTPVRDFIDWRLSLYNSGSPEDIERLDAILEMQKYRLSFWKVAAEEINYRRFFNINGLISLRSEEVDVFNHIHRLVKDLVSQGYFTGIRVDHVDGLFNPAEYLRRLRGISDDLYIVVEKILGRGEYLPAGWPVQGTTGYDFLNHLNWIFCRRENERECSRIYFGFTEHKYNIDELAAEKKRLIIEKHMTGDVDNLAYQLKQISGNDRYGRDITMAALRKALVELIAFFPVYRTYIESYEVSEADSGYIKSALDRARIYAPEYSFEYDFLEKCLNFRYTGKADEDKTARLLRFIMRLQQYTGPFMAKGFEDTVLYIVNRLVSLNEVGGDPGCFGITLDTFHDYIRNRALSGGCPMNATSTHDTKRNEDVRCRINVLSEIPGEWKKELGIWSRLNRLKKEISGDGPVPDRNDEYFIYQTLIGTFPLSPGNHDDYVRRIREYMVKSVREAKIHTAWIKPDADYEVKLLNFIDRILDPSENSRFMKHFIPFQKKTAFFGMLNSLAQVIIKIASPGVPDFYQGSELWDLRLVDPDNRGKIDYNIRSRYLDYICEQEENDVPALVGELWETWHDGRIKLFLIHRLLKARKKMKELFSSGEYIPLDATGRFRDSVVAFMRMNSEQAAIAVAPRFLADFVPEGMLPAGDIWEDTSLIIPGDFHCTMEDSVTGHQITLDNKVMLSKVMTVFPGVLLCNPGRDKLRQD